MSKDAYASGLTWEQVFNGNHKPWATVGDVFSAAESTGYEYAVYRGTLYYRSSLSGTPWLTTFLGPEALGEGAADAAQLRDTLRKRDVKIEEMARGQDRLRRERDLARGTVVVDPLCLARYDHKPCPADGAWHPLPKVCGLSKGHKEPHGPTVVVVRGGSLGPRR